MTTQEKEQLYLQAKDAYYNSDSPIMSDYEFDLLHEELEEMGSDVVNLVGSSGESTGLEKVKHLTPMKSLRKLKVDDEEFQKHLNRWNEKASGMIEASVKLDGNAGRMIFDGAGTLVRALTRGDGEYGFDITDKFEHMDVPMRIKTPVGFTGFVEISGEVVIKKATFDGLYSDKFKNARNFVGGKLGIELKKKSPEIQAECIEIFKNLDFYAYDIILHNPVTGVSEQVDNTMETLETLGFNTTAYHYKITHNSNIDSFLDKYFQWYKSFQHEYLADGVVLKFTSPLVRKQFGDSQAYPKWAVALKFETDSARTRILSYEWTVGTNRKLTPVAILEPVELMGTTVSRVSMSNLGTIVSKGAYPNCEVTIEKAGDIIPYVKEVHQTVGLKSSKYENYPFDLITDYSNIDLNDLQSTDDDSYNLSYMFETDDIKIRKLHKGIKILGINNIGLETTKKIFEAGVRDISELFDSYKMSRENLISSGVFVNGRALEVIFEALESLERVDFHKVVNACQFEGCGSTMSVQIARYLNDLPHDFSGLEKKVYESIINNEKFERDYLVKVESNMINWGAEITHPSDDNENQNENQNGDNKMYTFEMTGSPKSMGWDTKEAFVHSLNDNFVKHTSLTKDTDYLITDNVDSKSGKAKKALKYGIPIISYEEFYQHFKKL